MKKLRLILLLMLGMVVSMQAQDITGKWKCSKEILDRLNLGYEDISGHYTFYKNGKFKLRIKGNKRTRRYNTGIGQNAKTYTTHSNHRNLSIKASGKYMVKDGKITTVVRPKDVKSYVDISARQPKIPDTSTGDYEYRKIAMQELHYDKASSVADVQSNMIRAEKYFMWSWRDLSVRQEGDSLVIGKIIKCSKK
ncbi:MAG: hypothetical protein J6B33_06825 [Prevotella sp.]|nr:hypothetical protein [Prevotella sp.]